MSGEADEKGGIRKQISSDQEKPKLNPEEVFRYYNPQEPDYKSQDIMFLDDKKIKIVDVWNDNYIQELEKIITLTQRFNIISIDTEFPGICKIPQKIQFQTDEEYEYASIRENLKYTKLIQIGISIADEKGKVPEEVSTWQFNFQFNKEQDLIQKASLDLLERAGIDFKKFDERGIQIQPFAEYFMVSDLVLNDEIKWVAFHGGHDFGYLIKMLLNDEVPERIEVFDAAVRNFFPQLFDIKYIIRDSEKIRDYGLSKLANELKLKRIGPQHQAGSDSLMTLQVYFKLRDEYYKDRQDLITKSNHIIYGIGRGFFGRYNSKQDDQPYGQVMNDMISTNSQMPMPMYPFYIPHY